MDIDKRIFEIISIKHIEVKHLTSKTVPVNTKGTACRTNGYPDYYNVFFVIGKEKIRIDKMPTSWCKEFIKSERNLDNTPKYTHPTDWYNQFYG